MPHFIGRQSELQKLNDLKTRGRAGLVVIKGRRRIGKSRLAAEFAKDYTFLDFSGLAPESGMDAQTQRNFFAACLCQFFRLPPQTFLDWTIALQNLSHYLDNKPTVILFDEISWMGSKDPSFIPKLKAWWDLDIQNRPNIILIFCGSVSTWVEENIINSTSFFGRISLILELHPLTLTESAMMLQKQGFHGSPHDIYKVLSVAGGIPWYLELFLSHYSADQNIHRLCFEEGGLLTGEFQRISHDLYTQKGSIYKNILECLSGGMKPLDVIRSDLDYAKSGTLSTLMGHLIVSGFVTKHH